MAHKVLSSDMAQLIRTMKLAQQYSSTVLDSEYRKNMLQAAHVLAVDSKNLLDVIDTARRKKIYFEHCNPLVDHTNDCPPAEDNLHLESGCCMMSNGNVPLSSGENQVQCT